MSSKLKPLYTCLMILVMIAPVSSQTTIKENKKTIQAAYPDKKCYAASEELNFEFEIRNGSLQVTENYRSVLFTPESDHSRYHTVFYDDYSEVKKIDCESDGRGKPAVNVIYTNYQSDGIFHDDLKLCAFQMDMDKNVNYEVSYTKLYNDPRLFTRFFFHDDYPIAEKTIRFIVPEWLHLEIKPVNFEGYQITETSKSGKKKEIVYTIKNAMSIPNETHAPGILKYLPHLLVFIKSYDNGHETVSLFNDHHDVYKWNHKLVSEVDNKEGDLKPILASIIKNEKDSFKVMEKIFYWVQDNVRYIAFEDGIMGYKPAGAGKVCNLLFGDCKGMANLTRTLLKMAGFDARLTWIGTDDIPYDNDLPTLAVYNHMICTVIFRGKKYFLDATESYIAINDYAERIQARPCMVENGKDYLREQIPDLSYERNLQREVYSLKIQDNQLIGSSQNTFSGETKTDFLRHFNDIRSGSVGQALDDYLTANNANLNVSHVSTSDLNERAIPLNINYSFVMKNSLVKNANNELFVFANKNKDLALLYFDSTRVCDYVFNSKYYIQTTCSIDAGAYLVKKVPAALLIDNAIFSFDLKYEQKAGSLVLNKTVKIKTGHLNKKDFALWNEAIKKARQFYDSPVILAKK